MSALAERPTALAPSRSEVPPLAKRLAARGLDGATLFVVPGLLVVLGLFVYPFLYGLALSFAPKAAAGAVAPPWWGNYGRFFTDGRLWGTLPTTFLVALPPTILNVVLALAVAYRLRAARGQRIVATVLVLPVALGTVLVAEGLLNYLGPQGWLNRSLMSLGLVDGPVRLVRNYWGVALSLIVTGFPFAFLMLLSYVTGVDPRLPQAAATLGAGPWQRFRHVYLPLLAPGLAMTFCLAFVQAFSVFPSAVLLGAPAGPTRVISIAAYEAAFEDYDYGLASAIAILMGLAQLALVAAVLGLRGLAYRGPVTSGKG